MTHPYEEYRMMKAAKRENDMRMFINDAHHGIPNRCPCGGRMVNEVAADKKFDTLPRKKFFTCDKFEVLPYQDDGLHFRQPWVFAIEDEVKGLLTRCNEMAAEIAALKDQLRCLTHP
ncbi:hypothetical protein Bca4012_025445 [Brassica carinata]